jgi:hypothetical protein
MARPKGLSLAALSLGLSLGCVGNIGGDRPGGGSTDPDNTGRGGSGAIGAVGGTGSGGAGGTIVDPPPPNSAAGVIPLRRLDHREYNNTVRDLLGDDSAPADKFPSDHDDEFGFRRPGIISSQDYSTVRDAAELLAANAVKNIGTLAPCTGAEDGCARKFATSFGMRAYRRPLAPAEVENLMTLYKEARAMMGVDYAGAVRLMIEGILQSPSFLYHWEGGPEKPTVEGRLVRLSDYENASHLSYFLWGTMPDQALFDAAAGKALNTPAQLEAQAKRMIADPRARETVSQFLEEWMGLDKVSERQKDLTLYPEFKNDDLKAAMLEEARAFIANVVFDGDGKLATLLTANFSFVNQPLGPIYGMQGVQGMDLKQMQLDPNQRAGLLTQPGFLTVTGATQGSNPVKRGRKIYEGLLCGELPPPPANVPPPKPASAGGTTRERFAEHSAQACAMGCHSLMDPIGFAYENYDGIGKFRTMDNGGQVDASGKLDLDGKSNSFNNARDLAGVLASSATVQHCFTQQWIRFLLKRKDTDADKGSVDAIAATFAKSGGNLRDLLVSVAGSRSFRYRAPAAGEILQ